MADYQRLITTEDIQRRYNLQGLESDRKIIQTLNNNLTKTFGIIKNYITCMTSLGSKEQYFLSGVPTLENYPYTEWEDPEDHLNSVYYDTDGGTVYIFKYNSEGEYYYWEESTDSSLLNAMSVANSQADVSEDNLRRVFYEQPTVPYNVGDIWINGSKIYRCMRNELDESQFYQDDWIDYLQYNDSVATSNALRILGEFKETVETEYATKVLLETTANTINAEVNRVQTLAEGKSATYTEQPTPPYYKGDTYIKEVTDSETGITMNLIYVCQYSRETGTYHEEDFSLQPGYATLSQIKVTNDTVTTTVAKVDGQDAKIAQVQQSVNEINAKIQDIANITVTETTENGFMTITGVNTSEPIEITIIPRVDDIAYLYPHGTIYPSDTLFSNIRKLEFHNTYDDTYYYLDLPGDLLYYNSEVYDEFLLHYGDGTQADPPYFEIIKRVGINNEGYKYILENEQVVPYTYQHINLTNGEYDITLLGYTRAYMKITLMASNLYTTQFATKVELNTAISVTSEHFNVVVSKKVGKTEVISSINQTAEAIKIQAGKIDIAGTITAINNNTSTTINGNKITTGSIGANQVNSSIITTTNLSAQTINANQITTGTLNGNNVNVTNINANNIKTGTLKSQNYVANTSGTSINLSNGVIDTKNFKVSSNGTVTASGATITGSITATSGTIGGCSISNGVLKLNDANINNLNASKINAGTLSVDRIPNLTANKITTGTLNGNNVNIINLNASNITTGTLTADKVKGGTLSGASINIGTSSYYLRMGSSWTRHPEVSGINVGSGGIAMNNHGISNCHSLSNSSGDLYLASNSGTVHIGHSVSGKNKPIEVYDSKCYINQYLDVTTVSFYVRKKNGTRISIQDYINEASSRKVKENIKPISEKFEEKIYNEVKNLKLYSYDYKKEFREKDRKNKYGFMIDDVENLEIAKLLDIENSDDYSLYSGKGLAKLDLLLIKQLQDKIERLEGKYGKTINN